MKTILVVEADPTLRLHLASALGGEESHVLAVDTLDAARDALDAFMPALVVGSVDLRDGSGYELSRTVRALHGNRVAVMLLCADGAEPMSALLAGADDVIAKPTALDAIRVRCVRLLRQVRHTSMA